MKRCLLSIVLLFLVFPGILTGDDFLGLPLVPGGKVIEKTDAVLVMEVAMPHDQALEFFKNVLKGEKDIKIREWESSTFIEDDGARPWHSITIPKQEAEKITITIKKDSWSWIFTTLTLRYLAVFIVLLIIYVSILVSGKVIAAVEKRTAGKKAAQAG
ncbi:MAG: hypothetical protein MUO68_05110 [Desulfobacteraceae bacterium]|nr:hypothetical protein [Desulfobacteraceae bacterium]